MKRTKVMPFGKHKGQEIAIIPVEYLEWLVNHCNLRGSLKRMVVSEYRKKKGLSPTQPIVVKNDTKAILKRAYYWYESGLQFIEDLGRDDLEKDRLVTYLYEIIDVFEEIDESLKGENRDTV